jgi:hypothetical protein
MKRKKGMVQTAVWLDRATHKLLKKQGGKGGLGKQIRARIDHSININPEPISPLAHAITDLVAAGLVELNLDGKFVLTTKAKDLENRRRLRREDDQRSYETGDIVPRTGRAAGDA